MAAQPPSVKAKISLDDALIFLHEAGGDVRLAAEMAFKAVKSPSEFLAAMLASFSEAMGENLRVFEECPLREFRFSLVQTPSIDVNETSFKIWADAASVLCKIRTIRPNDNSEHFCEIKKFLIGDWGADHLGSYLAEICLDLNSKICGITVDDSRLLDPVYSCSYCDHETRDSCWGFDSMVDHIVKTHPMWPLVKSARKT